MGLALWQLDKSKEGKEACNNVEYRFRPILAQQ